MRKRQTRPHVSDTSRNSPSTKYHSLCEFNAENKTLVTNCAARSIMQQGIENFLGERDEESNHEHTLMR